MKRGELFRRYLVFVFSLVILVFGVALIIKAELGVSPMNGLSLVLSTKITGISLGTFTFLINMVLILGQILVLRKNYNPVQLLQIPMSMLLGVFTDGAMWVVRNFAPEVYWERMLVLLVGCVLMAISSSLGVVANVLLNSGEALSKGIADTYHINFSKVKIVIDVSIVILAFILSMVFLGRNISVREGTVIISVLVGALTKPMIKWFMPLNKWMIGKN